MIESQSSGGSADSDIFADGILGVKRLGTEYAGWD